MSPEDVLRASKAIRKFGGHFVLAHPVDRQGNAGLIIFRQKKAWWAIIIGECSASNSIIWGSAKRHYIWRISGLYCRDIEAFEAWCEKQKSQRPDTRGRRSTRKWRAADIENGDDFTSPGNPLG